MSDGYHVTAEEVACLGRLFSDQVQSILHQARLVGASTVAGNSVGEPFSAAGEMYASLILRLEKAITAYATRADVIATSLLADAARYETSETHNTAGLGGL
ncbi:MAG: hypothetical protein M3308_10255 [Actinomycetota bacterium]|nr:hypothetical protein [Actinomycetota bacterium]